MTIASLPTSVSQQSLAATGRSNPAGSALTSDFDAFLQMLTAQARYQDPLEPIDSTEYASQLAQFSMVEQQVQTNDMLALVFGQMGTANLTGYASWVGMEARAMTPMFFDGSPITVSPNPASVSDQVFMVVHDENGTEVDRRPIPISADPIEWNGIDSDGSVLPSGVYSFTVESYQNGDVILSEPAEVYGRIIETQSQGGNVILILEGGQAILSSSVTALREAS